MGYTHIYFSFSSRPGENRGTVTGGSRGAMTHGDNCKGAPHLLLPRSHHQQCQHQQELTISPQLPGHEAFMLNSGDGPDSKHVIQGARERGPGCKDPHEQSLHGLSYSISDCHAYIQILAPEA